MNPELLALQFRYTHSVVNRNLDGITHAESCRPPEDGGNSLNWVLGHITTSRNGILRALGEEPAVAKEIADRYARGSTGVADADDGAPFEDLLAAYNASQERILGALGRLDGAALAAPAPFTLFNPDGETLGSLLASLVFHEAYHAGQTGVLRRASGRAGAIR